MASSQLHERAISFFAKLEKSGNRLWGAHVRVPKTLVRTILGTGSRRVICTLNGSREFQCALLPLRDGVHVISVNKKLRDTMHLKIGDGLRGSLRPDRSKHGLPFPEELQELLRQDPEGRRLFQKLSPGRQRTLLYIAGSVKHTGLRAARAVIIVRHLRANKGTINYKLLHKEIASESRRSDPLSN